MVSCMFFSNRTIETGGLFSKGFQEHGNLYIYIYGIGTLKLQGFYVVCFFFLRCRISRLGPFNCFRAINLGLLVLGPCISKLHCRGPWHLQHPWRQLQGLCTVQGQRSEETSVHVLEITLSALTTIFTEKEDAQSVQGKGRCPQMTKVNWDVNWMMSARFCNMGIWWHMGHTWNKD